jgi:putative membrane protein (TIGR04086 family)
MPVRLAVSAGIGLAVFTLLLLMGAAVCLKLDLPRERLAWVGIPLAAAAAFLAGDLHVRPSRKQGLLSGLLSGAALYAGVLLLAVVISRAPVGVNAVLLLLAALLGGAAGGVFSANRRPAGNRSVKSRRR